MIVGSHGVRKADMVGDEDLAEVLAEGWRMGGSGGKQP